MKKSVFDFESVSNKKYKIKKKLYVVQKFIPSGFRITTFGLIPRYSCFVARTL